MGEPETTSPVEVILGEGPTVTIGGKEYVMRRLGTRDVFKAARILSKGMRHVAPAFLDKELKVELVGLLFVAALPYAEEEAADFLGGVIGVNAEQFLALPPEAVLVVGDGLAKHQDLKAFFDIAVKLAGELLKKMS